MEGHARDEIWLVVRRALWFIVWDNWDEWDAIYAVVYARELGEMRLLFRGEEHTI